MKHACRISDQVMRVLSIARALFIRNQRGGLHHAQGPNPFKPTLIAHDLFAT
jgi:hypothetical protein